MLRASLVTYMPLLNACNDKEPMGIFITDLILQILSFVSQKEPENIRYRQAEDIAENKQRAVPFGWLSVLTSEIFPSVVAEWEDGLPSFEEALEKTGLSYGTFYRRLWDYRKVSNRPSLYMGTGRFDIHLYHFIYCNLLRAKNFILEFICIKTGCLAWR